MHRPRRHPTSTPTLPLPALAAGALAALLMSAGPARADCGCPDDGHGSPQKPVATGPSSWLSALLDARVPQPRPSRPAPR